jgi:hypothetical protein
VIVTPANVHEPGFTKDDESLPEEEDFQVKPGSSPASLGIEKPGSRFAGMTTRGSPSWTGGLSEKHSDTSPVYVNPHEESPTDESVEQSIGGGKGASGYGV